MHLEGLAAAAVASFWSDICHCLGSGKHTGSQECKAVLNAYV